MIQDSHAISLLLMTMLALGLLGAAITDVRSCKIPNAITFSLALWGLLIHGFTNGLEGLLFSLKGLGVGLGLLIMFYIWGGMGAGDVKLLGAVGAIIGPSDVFIAFLVTASLGGLYAIGLMILTWGLPSTAERVRVILTTWLVTRIFTTPPPSSAGQPKLRYGLVIGLGTLGAQGWRLMEAA